jgi:hypothetical protein
MPLGSILVTANAQRWQTMMLDVNYLKPETSET